MLPLDSYAQRGYIKSWEPTKGELVEDMERQGFDIDNRDAKSITFSNKSGKYDKYVKYTFRNEDTVEMMTAIKSPCRQSSLIRGIEDRYGRPSKESDEEYFWENTNSILMIKKQTDGNVCVTYVLNPEFVDN